jgi:hypothetical protein|tara:strand:- start:80 stop:289 length:210 start_codon:yes stop_codon:yes gene_type:complete
MVNEEVDGRERRSYGDESLRHTVKARDMTPEEARSYLEGNPALVANLGPFMEMHPERKSALEKRAKEKE